MKVKIIKDWAHSLAPNQIFKAGSVAELSAGDVHAGIESGFIQDPSKQKVEAEKPIEKSNKAMSKKHKETR